MKLLFIGNSHTYYGPVPEIVAGLFRAVGVNPHVTMLTKGGMTLDWHAGEINTAFNIRCGGYDTVIAQDRATGFDPTLFAEGAKKIKEMADKAGSRFVLYMPWAGRDNRAAQPVMTKAYREFARANSCPFAPAGEVFGKLLQFLSPAELYRDDGNHATPLGSYAAAVTVFYTLTGRKRAADVNAERDPGALSGIPIELCARIHGEACRAVRLFNG